MRDVVNARLKLQQVITITLTTTATTMIITKTLILFAFYLNLYLTKLRNHNLRKMLRSSLKVKK